MDSQSTVYTDFLVLKLQLLGICDSLLNIPFPRDATNHLSVSLEYKQTFLPYEIRLIFNKDFLKVINIFFLINNLN